MPRASALLLAVFFLATPPACADSANPGAAPPKPEDPAKCLAPGPLPLEARLLVPLNGNKTTLRLEVANAFKRAGVFPPLVNSTKLIVTYPDGKTAEWGRC